MNGETVMASTKRNSDSSSCDCDERLQATVTRGSLPSRDYGEKGPKSRSLVELAQWQRDPDLGPCSSSRDGKGTQIWVLACTLVSNPDLWVLSLRE
ncbi:hypothetical protein SLE2022_096040 [Rubroshorea leprosula]